MLRAASAIHTVPLISAVLTVSSWIVMKRGEGAISGDQLRLLEKDMAANDRARNIFVFLRRPLFSKIDPEFLKGKSFKDRAGRDALHALFVRNKVKAVVVAHEHLFSDITNDGVRYIISGGGGAPLYSTPQDAGFFHYMLVSVKDCDVKIDVISPYAIQIRTLFNNYGLEPRAGIEVVNTSNTGSDERHPCPHAQDCRRCIPRQGNQPFCERGAHETRCENK